MYPLKSSIEGPAFWQECSQSINEFPQDEDFQDFLNPPSDMESFMALDNIEEVTEKEGCNILPDILKDIGIPEEMDLKEDFSLESNQSLIDEVESYLQFVAGSPTLTDEEESSFESNWNLGDIKETDAEKVVIDHAADSADKIFDALTTGNVVQDTDRIHLNEADLQNAFTTSVVGKNGENVIIIIASPPTPTPAMSPISVVSPVSSVKSPYSMALSPGPVVSPGGSTGSGSDYEWSPSPASPSTAGKARKKYQRKVPSTPPSGPYPKEKTERKKAQNRTAAYKYREKKKAEQEAIDDELNHLADRNVVLRKRMSDLEIELKCLKKLMAETGLNAYL